MTTSPDRVAIVGSRHFPPLDLVDTVVAALPRPPQWAARFRSSAWRDLW